MSKYGVYNGYFRGQGVSRWDRGTFVKKSAYYKRGLEVIFTPSGNITSGIRVQCMNDSDNFSTEDIKLYISRVSFDQSKTTILEEEPLKCVELKNRNIQCPDCISRALIHSNQLIGHLINDPITKSWKCMNKKCSFKYTSSEIDLIRKTPKAVESLVSSAHGYKFSTDDLNFISKHQSSVSMEIGDYKL